MPKVISVQYLMASILQQTIELMKLVKNHTSFLTSIYLCLIFLVLKFGTTPDVYSIESSCSRLVKSVYNSDIYFPLHIVLLLLSCCHIFHGVKVGTFSILDALVLLPVFLYFIFIFI